MDSRRFKLEDVFHFEKHSHFAMLSNDEDLIFLGEASMAIIKTYLQKKKCFK